MREENLHNSQEIWTDLVLGILLLNFFLSKDWIISLTKVHILQPAGAGPHQAGALQAEQAAEEDHQAAPGVPGGVGEGQRRHQRGGREAQEGGAGEPQQYS